MIDFAIYPSSSAAMEGAYFALGVRMLTSAYPQYPAIVIPDRGDGIAVCQIVVGNVVVSGGRART
jgi:hypothetical protein